MKKEGDGFGTNIRDGPLGRVVPHQPRPGTVRSHRGNVDHDAASPFLAALLPDLLREGVAAEEDALDVDGHDLVKLLLRDLVGALPTVSSVLHPFMQHANTSIIGSTHLVHVARPRIVDQHVHPPPQLHGLTHRPSPVLRPRHVRAAEGHGLRRRGQRLARPGVDVADEDFGALADVVLGYALAETGGAAFVFLGLHVSGIELKGEGFVGEGSGEYR